ncbi:Uncharacterised protein [Mycobacterium tuberculosis]|uniref:Uncharacterized protein n=1 Tax=Mycobacterium tuberculosis TaxID=1773 RepID=A0A0U0TN09_MYCTX|nr:Uncharacterised protein [Mycobacterium tuberculosis]COX56083.1 Uncharacterised protein [Mycobacterium tuberculosis]COX83405.1 Uncharacterised protein [Mycobacterium tuberculosis]COY91346.1 Uncharacterised protein [Mycobacterium tuberculosis]COZ13527.1 Uncharacterised protein [Mycobacterium tuberculosis]
MLESIRCSMGAMLPVNYQVVIKVSRSPGALGTNR